MLACARTKLAVVARDERDAGRRQVLNLGHTVGHAIETATGYARYRHGEAVGLGLLAALTLSGQPELRARGRGAARGARAADEARRRRSTTRRVLAAVQRDKKRRGGRVGFVARRGARATSAPGVPVAERDVRAALGGAAMKNRVAVLHGINLGALDRRPARALRRADVHAARAADRRASGASSGCRVDFFQSNHEGAFVEELHKASDYADGLMLNPGAWTHYAWSLRDAVEIAGLPAVEVHLSDVDAREAVPARVGAGGRARRARSSGKGVDGYREALELLKEASA